MPGNGKWVILPFLYSWMKLLEKEDFLCNDRNTSKRKSCVIFMMTDIKNSKKKGKQWKYVDILKGYLHPQKTVEITINGLSINYSVLRSF